jgi:NTE family protein
MTALAEAADAGLLAGVPLFAGLPAGRLAALARAARRVAVPAGAVLFEQGDPGGPLYVVRSGRVEVVVDGLVVRVLGRGEAFGELAVLTGGRRIATIRTRRDSELLAIAPEDVENLLTDPVFARALLRQLAHRVPGGDASAAPRTGAVLALVPFDGATPPAVVRALARALAAELAGHAPTLRLDDDGDPGGWATRLDAAEAGHELVLLVAERPDDAWARFCRRQADRPLVLADTDRPAPGPTALPPGTQLVALGHRSPGPWVAALDPAAHHIVAPTALDRPGADLARLARRVCGRSLGVVLSGGGARGLAHIGVLDELRRAGLRWDRIGGTSMGAVIAAVAALGVDTDEMVATARRELVARRPFTDVTWPRHALIRGLRVESTLDRIFGDTRIEELRCGLFTVSVDLVAAEEVVNRRGRVTDAVALSVRLPGLVPPRRAGARLHVDGGVLDNLPIAVMAAEDEGPVLAVDVAQPFASAPLGGSLPRIVDTIARSMTLASWRRGEPDRALARAVITPALDGIGLFDFRRLDELVERGREAGRAAAAQLGDLRTAG